MALHRLKTSWQMWAHLPHDADWSITSYVQVMTVTTAEEAIVLTQALPEKLVSSCMLFFMRESIHPTWEHPSNCQGGCFSYKVSNKVIRETWAELCLLLAGESLSPDAGLMADVTGVSVSPKKGFCVLKIWMTSLAHQNPIKIVSTHLKPQGCMFKRHASD